MKKKIYITVGVFFLITIFYVYIVFMQKKYDSNIQNITKIISGIDENINYVNILYNEGDFYTISATIDISFGENKGLIISRVNENLRGDDMRIEKLGGYRFIGFNSDFSGSPYLHKKILETELSIELKTVIDIIKNYDKIYSFVESLEDIDSEKYTNYRKAPDWSWGTYNVNWPWGTHDFDFNFFEQGKKRSIIFRKDVTEITQSKNNSEEKSHDGHR